MRRMTLMNDRGWMEEDGESDTCCTLDRSEYDLWKRRKNEKEKGKNEKRKNKQTDIGIGAEGASKISETLKVNSTMTVLNLHSDE